MEVGASATGAATQRRAGGSGSNACVFTSPHVYIDERLEACRWGARCSRGGGESLLGGHTRRRRGAGGQWAWAGWMAGPAGGSAASPPNTGRPGVWGGVRLGGRLCGFVSSSVVCTRVHVAETCHTHGLPALGKRRGQEGGGAGAGGVPWGGEAWRGGGGGTLGWIEPNVGESEALRGFPEGCMAGWGAPRGGAAPSRRSSRRLPHPNDVGAGRRRLQKTNIIPSTSWMSGRVDER